MAKPSKPAKNDTKITRISASDESKKTVKPAKSTKKVVTKPAQAQSAKRTAKPDKSEQKTRNPLVALWRYIKGSWYELQQVRWPDRRSTWGMTGALLAFTLFFVLVILVLDYGFSQLFKLLMSN